MSWMEKLYETYERAQKMNDIGSGDLPVVPSHTTQQAHVEITIDGEGNFLRASILGKEDTLIPATESSSSRSSGGAPHPLCEKIQYIAADYAEYGGEKPSYFQDFNSGTTVKDGYFTLLGKWCEASGNSKLKAVYKYIECGTVVKDLVNAKILVLDKDGKLLKSTPDGEVDPEIFKGLTKKKGEYDQGDVFVRWLVNIDGEIENRVWKDEELIQSWIDYTSDTNEKRGLCIVTGADASLASLHPYKIRHSGDKAKLISSNDQSGFTFRGRFTDSDQACSVGYAVTQKAHSALRWLVGRQAFRNDDQAIVAWEISGKELPKMMENTEDAFLRALVAEAGLEMPADDESYSGDMGQSYALKLRNKIAGYRQVLDDRDDIVVMGLDSSTPGRMAITYYRELKGSDFLDRLEEWHLSYAWYQYYGKNKQFVGAPSPRDIAEVAFGKRIDTKLKKSTISRVLPCIVDSIKFPDDLQTVIFHRAVNRIALENWEWEKLLGVACGLYRGMHKEMNYKMALETERRSRDYLYGRLLAIAERMERIALSVTGEMRDTNAAKLMHRFAERPFTTWKQIELALVPYKTRLQSGRTGFLSKMLTLMDEIHCMFEADDYTSDAPLSGEFLLGYHCQRYELRSKATKDDVLPEENEIEENTTDQEDE